MAKFEILKPVDQVTGKRRLLDELKNDLENENYCDFRWLVAYAKSGPLIRLRDHIEKWRANSGTVRAIFGIDQQGTSREALELALKLCDEVYVTQEHGITFHPKAYIFTGPNKAKLYLGSNNLTVGGTETNFESAVALDVTLPEDNDALKEINELWEQLTPEKCPATRILDADLLKQLLEEGHVIDEKIQNKSRKLTQVVRSPKTKRGLKLKPPSALPKDTRIRDGGKTGTVNNPEASEAVFPSAKAKGLAIQIKPHHNGEIFLSKLAVNQNPSFFGFPFGGLTTPKKTGGTPYPQRLPDPIVNIQVYGADGALLLSDYNFALNTVFYEPKKEIRITASKLVDLVPEYSVMVITLGEVTGVDYDMAIFTPDSPEYLSWLATCNQQMPGGGKKPRKFGWF